MFALARRIPLPAMSAAALLSWSSAAHANGRFPLASQLVVDPGDRNHLVARTTFGVVESSDAGKSWRWICEKAIGYAGNGTYDPSMAVSSAGTMVVGVLDGLRTSADRGCAWTSIGAPLAGETVIDVAADPADARRVVAVTSTGLGGKWRTFVAESRDDAKTWAKLAADLPDDVAAETGDLTMTDPRRIYVSGRFGGPGKPWIGALLRSDDAGATWTRLDLDLRSARAPFIAGVDRRLADRLWIRLDGDDGDSLFGALDQVVTAC